VIIIQESKEIKWDYETPAENIYEFYLNPPVKDVDIDFKSLDPDKILKFLVDEHDFSQDRIEKVIKTLTEARQKSLQSWLK